MIKFSDNAERVTNPENIEKHSDIKSSDRMTNQETEAFWKAEFQKSHDEMSLDDTE